VRVDGKERKKKRRAVLLFELGDSKASLFPTSAHARHAARVQANTGEAMERCM